MTERERTWWRDGWRNGYGVASDSDPLLPGPLREGDLVMWRSGHRAGRADLLEDRADVLGAPSWAGALL